MALQQCDDNSAPKGCDQPVRWLLLKPDSHHVDPSLDVQQVLCLPTRPSALEETQQSVKQHLLPLSPFFISSAPMLCCLSENTNSLLCSPGSQDLKCVKVRGCISCCPSLYNLNILFVSLVLTYSSSVLQWLSKADILFTF